MNVSKVFPALFFGHGSPSNILLKEGKYYKSLMKFVESIPKPETIIVLSAHWETDVIELTSKNETIPIFENYETEFSNLIRSTFSGNSELTRSISYHLKKKGIKTKINKERGIDSAAWIPYSLMFETDDIPVIELSLPVLRNPRQIYKFGKSLIDFREGNLIIGSGNIVYNKKIMHKEKEAQTSGWAKDFDDWIEENLFGSIENLFKYQNTAPNANYAVTSSEHIDPMFFVLGLKNENEKIKTIYEGFEYSTTSMRCFEIRE